MEQNGRILFGDWSTAHGPFAITFSRTSQIRPFSNNFFIYS